MVYVFRGNEGLLFKPLDPAWRSVCVSIPETFLAKSDFKRCTACMYVCVCVYVCVLLKPLLNKATGTDASCVYVAGTGGGGSNE